MTKSFYIKFSLRGALGQKTRNTEQGCFHLLLYYRTNMSNDNV